MNERILRVGVDAWNLPGDRRGIGRYLRALLDVWDEAFADRIAVTLVVPEWHTWTVARRYRRETRNRRYAIRSRRLHTRASLDLLWFPFNGPSWSEFTLPAVATLHDASTFALEGFDETARASFRAAARTCAHIITDSSFSRHELARVLDLAPERITAIALGVSPPRAPARVAPDPASFGRFALFVGESERRKGLDTLVAALARLAGDDCPLALVVVGTIADPIPHRDEIPIHVLGHVDDATLAALYRSCSVFVYPSRYEGFGLPVLEAMSYGAPVVASSAAAIPEAGAEAAIYAPPGDEAAFAAQIRRVLAEPGLADSLRAAGYERARYMTWRRTAERTLEIFERVAGAADAPGGRALG
ncbi:MAG TPA: glycosyltransferase family 1 protein [Candidatus Baltobacteraceae bacterium]